MNHTQQAAASEPLVGQPSIHRLAERPVALNQVDMQELCALIDTVWLRGYMPPPEVEVVIDRAKLAGSDFTSRLAIRALRLEQALIVAQERIIRLTWGGRATPGATPRPPCGHANHGA